VGIHKRTVIILQAAIPAKKICTHFIACGERRTSMMDNLALKKNDLSLTEVSSAVIL